MIGGIRDEVLRDLQDSASMYLHMYEAERTSSAQLRSRADAAEAEVERLTARLADWERQMFSLEDRAMAAEAYGYGLRKENERLRGYLMTVFQRARNDVNRREGGVCYGTVTFADYPFAKRLVRDLQPILFPEVAE